MIEQDNKNHFHMKSMDNLISALIFALDSYLSFFDDIVPQERHRDYMNQIRGFINEIQWTIHKASIKLDNIEKDTK